MQLFGLCLCHSQALSPELVRCQCPAQRSTFKRFHQASVALRKTSTDFKPRTDMAIDDQHRISGHGGAVTCALMLFRRMSNMAQACLRSPLALGDQCGSGPSSKTVSPHIWRDMTQRIRSAYGRENVCTPTTPRAQNPHSSQSFKLRGCAFETRGCSLREIAVHRLRVLIQNRAMPQRCDRLQALREWRFFFSICMSRHRRTNKWYSLWRRRIL